jgi:hypothetical protein
MTNTKNTRSQKHQLDSRSPEARAAPAQETIRHWALLVGNSESLLGLAWWQTQVQEVTPDAV